MDEMLEASQDGNLRNSFLFSKVHPCLLGESKMRKENEAVSIQSNTKSSINPGISTIIYLSACVIPKWKC